MRRFDGDMDRNEAAHWIWLIRRRARAIQSEYTRAIITEMLRTMPLIRRDIDLIERRVEQFIENEQKGTN